MTETTVLITGESGTARKSSRGLSSRVAAQEPAVRRAELRRVARERPESELFGDERGAFTSAHEAKPGQIELAAGGVSVLDEVAR